jgi:hypothetical protein
MLPAVGLRRLFVLGYPAERLLDTGPRQDGKLPPREGGILHKRRGMALSPPGARLKRQLQMP